LVAENQACAAPNSFALTVMIWRPNARRVNCGAVCAGHYACVLIYIKPQRVAAR
jgi:hypothetical protein